MGKEVEDDNADEGLMGFKDEVSSCSIIVKPRFCWRQYRMRVAWRRLLC